MSLISVIKDKEKSYPAKDGLISYMKSRDLSSQKLLSFEESGLPESYRSLWEANPWIRTSSNSTEAKQFALESDKYIADLYNRAYEEMYESPLEESNRLRAAGINPDLSGLDNAGEAADSAPFSDFQFKSPQERFSSVADTLLSLTSMALSIPTGISGIKSLALRNDAQSIENAGLMSDLVNGRVDDFPDFNLSPEELADVKEQFGEDGYYLLSQMLRASNKSAEGLDSLAQSLFPGRGHSQARLRSQFKSAYQENRNTMKSQLSRLNLSSDLAEANQENKYASTIAKVYQLYRLQSLDNMLEAENRLADYRKRNSDKISLVEDKKLDADLSSMDASIAGSEYSRQLSEKLSPSLSAAAQNKQNKYLSDYYGALKGEDRALDENEIHILNTADTKQRELDLGVIKMLESELLSDPDQPWYSDRSILGLFSGDTDRRRQRRERFDRATSRYYHSGSSRSNSSGLHFKFGPVDLDF